MEVRAAMTSSRKKIDDHTMLSGMSRKMLGRVMKTSDGPEAGSMPALKTAGKITTPERMATSVSISVTLSAVWRRFVSRPKYDA